ncbi:hypothetical protein GRF59_14685 [Paenibacillus sp. HJL G12]|uniref:RiboL-PSP-HEPN domain-containing protein n=1 Tax=Paenibacillus dendrobii TaxID=2691084 RepID=A0A7X3ILI5_9BACL|nr:hypothetical protein [Paenibacillus dendrobii]MWV44865.1 hypothetical protein [Paenibacillus dendrobii]
MLMIRIIHSNSVVQFEMLNDYAEEMEELIKSKSTKYLERLKELSNKYSEDEQDDFWYYNRERLTQFHVDYPNLLRSSILISAISELENVLKKIKQELINYSILDPEDFTKKNKEEKGSSIEKTLKIFCDKLSIGLISELDSWNEVRFLIDIRNRVTHSVGQVHPIEQERLYNLLSLMEESDDRTIRLSPYHELIFLENSSTFIINSCLKLLKSITESVLTTVAVSKN